MKSLGGLPEVEVSTIQGVKTIQNKFPASAVPKDGKIYGTAKIENGRILINEKPYFSGKGQVDYIIDKQGNMLLGKKHSFLANNGEVQAAGQIKIVNGKVKGINNLSGHYRPTAAEAKRFADVLRKSGVDLKGTFLEIFEFEKNSSGYITNQKRVVSEYLK